MQQRHTTPWQPYRFYRLCLGSFNARSGGFLVKRLLDIIVSATMLILLIPFLPIMVLIIRLDSPGPAFFSQIRVGKQGQLFRMWKFRSMYKDAEQRKAALMKHSDRQDDLLFKMINDPRTTRVGRFIRKTSIDEIPQIWNVLLGEMSLVGPRPPLPSEVAKYTAYQRLRLEVKPGITCIWQVSGRSKIPFEQQVEMDLQYIYTQSFYGDIALLFKTVFVVFNSDGAW
jgi:exopolysaccharide biosynthesis polyprenyl glycosylphosphotransferase